MWWVTAYDITSVFLHRSKDVSNGAHSRVRWRPELRRALFSFPEAGERSLGGDVRQRANLAVAETRRCLYAQETAPKLYHATKGMAA